MQSPSASCICTFIECVLGWTHVVAHILCRVFNITSSKALLISFSWAERNLEIITLLIKRNKKATIKKVKNLVNTYVAYVQSFGQSQKMFVPMAGLPFCLQSYKIGC